MNTAPAYRAELDHLAIDCNRIATHLYQGSAPPNGAAVALAHFDVLVLCAEELRPIQQPQQFPGVEVLYCPIDDPDPRVRNRMDGADWQKAVWTARQVASRIRQDKRVLVTCAQGINRSGLVCAMVVHMLTKRPGDLCVQHVKRARPGALRNPLFVEALSAIG